MKKNDIVFLNLHRKYLDYIPTYGGFLGIYILSAWVNANGYCGQGFAGTLHEGRVIVDNLCLKRQVGMLGLYCDYANVTENIWLSQYVKKKYGIPVILGGPQATSLGEDFLRKSGCDALVFYEGELTVMELLNCYLDGTGELKDIRGIAFIDESDRFQKTQPRGVIRNLDAVPFIDDDCYLIPRNDWSEFSIMTGRGCPFRCAFCHEGAVTKAVRYRSVDNVLKEIELCLKKMPAEVKRKILFVDDTFTLKPDRVRQICEGLKEFRSNYNFTWFCEAHVGMLKHCPDMIEDLANAGCGRIQIGIEAGTGRVLDAYRKNISPDDIREVVAKCRDAGIPQLFGNIIVGGAFFSEEIFQEDLRFGEELIEIGQGILELGVVSYWPLPETALTKNAGSYGIRITDADFITTVDDFPQTETDEFDVWGINSCVQKMRRRFHELMIRMLRNRMVPDERMRKWISRDGIEDIVPSYWRAALSETPEIFAWYHLLSANEVLTSPELSESFSSARPIRLISLNSYAEYQGRDRTQLLGYKLTDLERDTLVLCTGRLTIGEITVEMMKRHSDMQKTEFHFDPDGTSGMETDRYADSIVDSEDRMSEQTIRDIILKLEKMFLVAFARE